MNELTSITFALCLALLGGTMAKRMGYPRIIGQLCLSLVLAIPVVHHFFSDHSIEIIAVLAELGIIFLLLLTGFELDLAEFKKNQKTARIIAILAALVPFGLGFGLALLLGYSLTTGFVLGACMSVTAEGTKVALLLELKQIKTRVANIMLGAGILDDLFEILFLSGLLLLSHQTGATTAVWHAPVKMLLFGGVVVAAFKFVPRLVRWLRDERDQELSLFSAMLGVGLVMALLSEWAGTGSIVGAFLAGILLQKSFFDPATREAESQSLKLFVFAFIIPFFFFNIGIHFDFQSFIEQPWLVLLVLVVAIIGKIGGTLLAYPWVDLSFKQLWLIGWGMNSRGVMDLVLAGIAFQAGLIDQQLYSAIVFMAMTTTVIFPFVLRRMIARDPQIME